jgi:hypothetical protein
VAKKDDKLMRSLKKISYLKVVIFSCSIMPMVSYATQNSYLACGSSEYYCCPTDYGSTVYVWITSGSMIVTRNNSLLCPTSTDAPSCSCDQNSEVASYGNGNLSQLYSSQQNMHQSCTTSC